MEFRIVGPSDQALLADLFGRIDTTFFRPHPFTPAMARVIATRSGRDLYALLVDEDVPVAYGMLRGWDEGYPTPSLGIAVRSGLSGRGIGRRMMDELHTAAIERGSSSVRLRVHRDNTRARRLYEGLGYAYTGIERGELVMVLQLSQPAATGVRLLRPSDPAWNETVARARSSVFHTAGYHQYTAGFGRGTPFLAVVGDDAWGVAWPYLLRPVSDASLNGGSEIMDVSSVYGYPGPLAWGCATDDPKVGEALALIAETWRLQGAVSVFTRFNPLLGNAATPPASPSWAAPGSPGVVMSGMTVSVDLTLDIEEIRSQYSRGLSREIRRGRDAGLVTTDDTEWTSLPEFAEQYRETMERLHAAGFYFFTQVDFERLHRCLPEEAHLLVARIGGRLAAAGLFLDSGDHLEWHLVSSSNELIELSPSKVLVEDAIVWAKRRGFPTMHLGGGRGAQADSLFFFKGRFSPRRHPFARGSWVLDAERYAVLVSRHLDRLPPGSTIDASFFPTYRAWPTVTPPVGPT